MNAERRPAVLKKWRPRKWQPEYERMVYLSVAGLGNRAIGERLGYTKEHVSTILNLDEAEVLRNKILEKMREHALVDIPTTLGQIAEKTTERLLKVMHDEEMFVKNPFAIIDRGMEVLKGLGHLKHGNAQQAVQGGNLIVQGNAVIGMPSEVMEKLASGLEVANEAKRLNEGKNFKAIADS